MDDYGGVRKGPNALVGSETRRRAGTVNDECLRRPNDT